MVSEIQLSPIELQALKVSASGNVSDPVGAMRDAGINVSVFFKFGDWRGVDFTKSDVHGVSFRGSDLRGAKFTDEQIRLVLETEPLYPPALETRRLNEGGGDAITINTGYTRSDISLSINGRTMVASFESVKFNDDFDAIIRSVTKNLQILADKAGTKLETVKHLPCFWGHAAVLDVAVEAQVASALQIPNLCIQEDWVPFLTGALGGADGSLVVIGTGSFLARREGEKVTRIGGYGHCLGDDASPTWLGQALLKRCLHVLDGIAPASALSNDVLGEFGRQASRIVDFAIQASPGEYSSFAIKVFSAAQDGDALGLDLVQSGVDYIMAGLSALGWAEGQPLCLAGGAGPQYAQYLPSNATSSLVPVIGSSLDGGLFQARHMAH